MTKEAERRFETHCFMNRGTRWKISKKFSVW